MERRRSCLHGAMLGLMLLLLCFSIHVSGDHPTHPHEVDALKAVRRELKDPKNNLWNWEKTDPCEPGKQWNGVICTKNQGDGGYFHIQELRLLNMNLSGTLSPQLGQFPNMTILNFIRNNISGSIPKEIGNMTSLQFLLLTGNQISGPLPDELGYLPNIIVFQVDENNISGPFPKSFANLRNCVHFHMNNNSISGQIPAELSTLPKMEHFLLDNNKLSGHLPPELSQMPNLTTLQLDNNNFEGTEIPASYGNMSKLFKLSLRNCNLQGNVPDFSPIPDLLYLDLSSNKLNGCIPTNKLSDSITTIDLSHNLLIGSIPSSFSGLPHLQRLSLENNYLTGDVPADIWKGIKFAAASKLRLNFEHNCLGSISDSLNPSPNVTILLQYNPVCLKKNELDISQFCGTEDGNLVDPPGNSTSYSVDCPTQPCLVDGFYEYVPDPPLSCYCDVPLGVWIRLRSPSFSHFQPYIDQFKKYITSNLEVEPPYQLDIGKYLWQRGPRLYLFLKFSPKKGNATSLFITDGIQRICDRFATFEIPGDKLFGSYDLLEVCQLGEYCERSGMSKGQIAGIVLGSISCVATLLLAIALFYNKTHPSFQQKASKNKSTPKNPIKFDGVKGFSFDELARATDNFSVTSQVGQGGYGKVFKGILADGTVVAIKRAQQGSLQGEKEFLTEIEVLSRLHHRNLVSLVGYCDEEGEQMLVYEFLPNGSLHSLLSARFRSSLTFAMRLRIALDSAKGILYLHTEADPPIIHRDIKASNILLDSKFTAKVSDFGMSKVAPVPDGKEVGTETICTAVKGTPGYYDPAYFLTNMLTEKSDVYSLGIVFLELLTGMPPISHGKNIVREVTAACQSGKMFSIVDRNMGPYTPECLKKFMDLAIKCTKDETAARPSMSEVVRELENIISMAPGAESSESIDNNPLISQNEKDGSSSAGTSGTEMGKLYSEKNKYVFSDYSGSNLDSGAIPTIKPR
nr:probable LRR receptor-like serine/threonine-protein kinase At1g06840 isoform X1 [Ziziphus jujuba var. spinosa]